MWFTILGQQTTSNRREIVIINNNGHKMVCIYEIYVNKIYNGPSNGVTSIQIEIDWHQISHFKRQKNQQQQQAIAIKMAINWCVNS